MGPAHRFKDLNPGISWPAPSENEDCITAKSLLTLNHAWKNAEVVIEIDTAASTDCDHTTLPIGQPTAIREGSIVEIGVAEVNRAVGVFKGWRAPGLPIDGSMVRSEAFVVPAGGDFKVRPLIAPRHIASTHMSFLQVPEDAGLSIEGEGNPHVDKQYFNGQYNGVKVYARVCTPLRISAPGYVWKHKRGGVVSQNSTLYLARLSDLEDLAVGRSRQKVIKTGQSH